MALYRSLTIQGGVFTQIGNGDTVGIGLGVDTAPGQPFLFVGDTNATQVILGQSLSGTNMTVDNSAGSITANVVNQFILNGSIFQSGGRFNFSGDGPSGMSTVGFPGSLLSINSGGDLSLDGVANISVGSSSPGATILIGNASSLLTFFGQLVGQTKRTVTGALSLVADPNVQAILTSLFAALDSNGAGYGLIDNGTT